MNILVNFKTAKLLKEKGFDVECCESYYLENNPNKLEESFNKNKKWDFNFKNEYLKPYKSISAPTISEVVMWLYEKHGIWIHAMMSFKEFTPYIQCDWNYKKDKTNKVLKFMEKRFNSPTEAYEAAIEYCLTNLI